VRQRAQQNEKGERQQARPQFPAPEGATLISQRPYQNFMNHSKMHPQNYKIYRNIKQG